MDSAEFQKQMRYRDLLLGLVLGLSLFTTWSFNKRIEELADTDQKITQILSASAHNQELVNDHIQKQNVLEQELVKRLNNSDGLNTKLK